jgi:hypothetical protein
VVLWLGYGAHDREIVVRLPVGAKDFALLQYVKSSSIAHPASYSVGAGCKGILSAGVKGLGHEADRSSNAEIKNEWIYNSISQHDLMA